MVLLLIIFKVHKKEMSGVEKKTEHRNEWDMEEKMKLVSVIS